MNWFLFMNDAVEKIKEWKHEYNCFRSHSSLDNLTSAEVVKLCILNTRFSNNQRSENEGAQNAKPGIYNKITSNLFNKK